MEKFGNYALIKQIATGGMAQVFLAKEFGVSGFQRILAIKRVLPHLAVDDEFIEMFTEEARLSAQLSHQNIVQIYNFGIIDGAYFIAMEYIDGLTLSDLLSRTSWQKEQVDVALSLYIMAELCQGLDYAHNKRSLNNDPLNIVHRDISPKNVMLNYDGAVKLMDFGIAKAADQQRKETMAGTIKGKIAYLSPEQVMGQKLDRRSDIFSLGIVFYELLTSQRCFDGENEFSILFKIREGDITPPSQHNPKVTEELEAIVRKTLHQDREQRYQSGAELLNDLNLYRYKHGTIAGTRELAEYLRDLRSEDEDDTFSTLQKIDWAEVERQFRLSATQTVSTGLEDTADLDLDEKLGDEADVDEISDDFDDYEYPDVEDETPNRLLPVLLSGVLLAALAAAGVIGYMAWPRLSAALLSQNPVARATATPVRTVEKRPSPVARPSEVIDEQSDLDGAQPTAEPVAEENGSDSAGQSPEPTPATDVAVVIPEAGNPPEAQPTSPPRPQPTASIPEHAAEPTATPRPALIAVTITSAPTGASLSIDGKQIGKTPYQYRRAQRGSKLTLRLELSGYLPVQETIVVDQDSIHFPLKQKPPAKSTLRVVTSSPVQLFSGGKSLGTVGASGLSLNLAPGRHSFSAVGYSTSPPSFYRSEFSVALAPGESMEHTIRFPQSGTLNISATPPAVLYVDGIKIDFTPIPRLQITAGSHDLRFEFRNGRSRTIRQDVRAGRIDRVHATP